MKPVIEKTPSNLLFLTKSFTRKRLLLLASPTTKLFKSYAETCATLLRRSTTSRLPILGRFLHGHVIRSGLLSDFSVFTKLLTFYSSLNLIGDRDRLFWEWSANSDNISIPFSHNFIISDLVRSGDIDGACKVFDEMPERSAISWAAMVDGLMKCGRVREATRLYSKCPCHTVFSSTAMISGFVSSGLYKEALAFFCGMVASGLMPNHMTFTCVIKACTKSDRFDFGKSILGLVVKTNFENNLSVSNSLITLFVGMGDFTVAKRVFDEMPERDVISWTTVLGVHAEMGQLENARKLFDQMPERNEVSWSTMIARYNQSGDPMEALRLFKTMHINGFRPNVSCLSSVLSSSASLSDFTFGCQVHCHACKTGLDNNVFAVSSLIDMYCKCGKSEYGRKVFDSSSEKNVVCWNCMVAGYCFDKNIEEAEKLFDKIPKRDVASWNAIISGYTRNELFVKAIESFDKMLASGQAPSHMTFSSVLFACASISSLEKGRSIHAKILKLCMHSDVFLGTALTDMYAKSGDIDSCKKVFGSMSQKTEVSWAAMIQGLSDNGLAAEAISLFDKMRLEGSIKPNKNTFLSVLSACSHCGLVDKALLYFKIMSDLYGIQPSDKHYTCMVDLLARAGRLREAEQLVKTMPVKPGGNSWAALLGACSVYQNKEIGERAAEQLQVLRSGDSSGYVLLSNVYGHCKKWEEAGEIRREMTEKGVRKFGGYSSI